MFASTGSTGKPARRPEIAHIFFLLVVGVMVGLAVWSIGTAPKLRALPEEADTRSQLQAELRSIVKAAPLPTASQTTGTADRQQIPLNESWRPSWTWVLLILVIGSAFAVWAVINFYAAATEELDDEDEEPVGLAGSRISRGPALSAAAAAAAAASATPEWMKTAIRVGRDGVLALEAAGKVTSANPVAERLLGFEAGRLAGRNIFELIPDLGKSADDLRRFSQVTAPAPVKARKRGGAEAELQLALHRASDGQYVAVVNEPPKPAPAPAAEPSAKPTAAASAKASVGDGFDAEALHSLENELVMLSGYSELLAASLPQDAPERSDAEAVTRAAARATLLCHEVAPPPQPHGRSMYLNDFVMHAAPQLASILDPGCKVGGTIGSINAEVWADPDLLERSLASLTWRAHEWTGGLKSVQLTNANGRLDLRMMPRMIGGQPISRAAFDQLPAIDWIVAQGASIEMEHHPEMGIRFRLWLPASEAARKRPATSAPSAPAPPKQAAAAKAPARPPMAAGTIATPPPPMRRRGSSAAD